MDKWMQNFMENTNKNLQRHKPTIKKLEKKVVHLAHILVDQKNSSPVMNDIPYASTSRQCAMKLEPPQETPKTETFFEKVKSALWKLKELVSNKIQNEELSMVKLNSRCSVVLQNKLPPKEKDPGSFVLSCIIGNTTVSNALADLGASISVMPFSMFKHLGLGNPRPVNMVIEMADRSMQSPKGIVENILVKIHKFIFPVDFVILDIVEDNKVSIILGRPMLTTSHARIDVFGGKISLEVRKEQVILTPTKESPLRNWNPVEEFQDSDDNLGIGIDNFVKIDDLWDNLDPGSLTNKQPLIPEFLSIGNRVNRYNPYNLRFVFLQKAAYNFIIKHERVYTGNNVVRKAKNLQVFIGCHSFLTDFVILENVNEFFEKGLAEVIFGKPFKEEIGLEEDISKGIIWFKIVDDKTIFNMPRAKKRLSKLTTEQQNLMSPILKISDEDKAKGISHLY
ncbi:DNA damage-inducible protein 1-like protein [Tanacetum coccineum]